MYQEDCNGEGEDGENNRTGDKTHQVGAENRPAPRQIYSVDIRLVRFLVYKSFKWT